MAAKDYGDAKDYVLVTTYPPGANGLRIQEQVLKSEIGKGEYKHLSLEGGEVVEAHPASERPTSDLSEEESKAEGRE
jgi:hypothetical protein